MSFDNNTDILRRLHASNLNPYPIFIGRGPKTTKPQDIMKRRKRRG